MVRFAPFETPDVTDLTVAVAARRAEKSKGSNQDTRHQSEILVQVLNFRIRIPDSGNTSVAALQRFWALRRKSARPIAN
jgi:hypothetical protein